MDRGPEYGMRSEASDQWAGGREGSVLEKTNAASWHRTRDLGEASRTLYQLSWFVLSNACGVQVVLLGTPAGGWPGLITAGLITAGLITGGLITGGLITGGLITAGRPGGRGPKFSPLAQTPTRPD